MATNVLKRALRVLEFSILMTGLNLLGWILVDVLKKIQIRNSHFSVNDWAKIFYHPMESNLLNYLVMAAGSFSFFIFLYFWRKKKPETQENFREFASSNVAITIIFGQILLLAGAFYFFPSNKSLWLASMSTILSLLYHAPRFPTLSIFLKKMFFEERSKVFLWGVIFIVFAGLVLEPIKIASEPVLIFNEFIDFYGETKIRGSFQSNQTFLSKSILGGRQNETAEFSEKNILEYSHQVMGRGMFNHVGHMINPINEYNLGKPIRQIFMQYGLGNTLLHKYLMDLLGGASISNFFKGHLFFFLYYLFFLIATWVVFRKEIFVLIGILGLAIGHFSNTYLAVLMAPGINPSRHFFDVAAIASAYYFFKTKKVGALLLSFGFCILEILLNKEFGAMLLLSLILPCAVFLLESGKNLKLKIVFSVSIIVALISFILLSRVSSNPYSDNLLKTYFSGLFSWPASKKVIFILFIYLTVSYHFVIIYRKIIDPSKYSFLMVLFYIQGTLVYYFWAGLSNHLPLVAPILVVQLLFFFLMISENKIDFPWLFRHKIPAWNLTAALLGIGVIFFAHNFYFGNSGKREVIKNFQNHKCYRWPHPDNQVISTFDPSLFKSSLNLINRYSSGHGIYIISKYDMILPFLCGKYSSLPHFELNWYLIDQEKVNGIKSVFSNDKPRYIFVDSDKFEQKENLWRGISNFTGFESERLSRNGRLATLNEIFLDAAVNYKLVESSDLISVYERLNQQ